MRLILIALPLALAACAALPVSPAATEDACGASGYQSLAGQQLAAVTLPADLNARIIEPDSVVTMDFRADRLNIYVGRDGRIDRVSCG